jgi:hypothetical protein
MRKTCLALIALSVSFPSAASARPKCMSTFNELYREHYARDLRAMQCTVCHRGEKKTDLWKYGETLSEALGAKNVKNPDAIQRALRDVESKPSAIRGMTYGDLIRAGRLPAEGE